MTTRHDMTNTHLLVGRFAYHAPASLEAATALLAEHGARAALLAGGTNLLVWMKLEQRAPTHVIDLRGVPGLRGIARDDAGIRIGAATTIRAVRTDPLVRASVPGLADACASFGSSQIERMGTIGGNVCCGSPAADTVPVLLALDASLTLRGPKGEREVGIAEFLLGPGRVALEPGEMLTALWLPLPAPGTGSAFLKLARVTADLAKASVAVMLRRDRDCVIEARLAFGSVGPTVLRTPDAEAVLAGEGFSPELALAAARRAAEAIAPIDDVRSTAAYRKRAAVALAHDALLTAWERAGAPGGGDADPATHDEATVVGPFSVAADERRTITLIVNGTPQSVEVAPNELLLNVLRERFDLTGTKYGCGIGECGACTVWLDGEPALACLVLAVAADGREVLTVEGLAGPDGTLDPVQQAFIDENAFQCGYCTPGMLMMTKKLLEELPGASEPEIHDALKGNFCRCTGYASIVRAVERLGGGKEA